MRDELMSKEDLLAAWRDAVRGAELAERLADAAVQAAGQADAQAAGWLEVAELAGRVAESAQRAAERARELAIEASARATMRNHAVPAAESTLAAAKASESDARAAYQRQSSPSDGEAAQPSARSEPAQPHSQ